MDFVDKTQNVKPPLLYINQCSRKKKVIHIHTTQKNRFKIKFKIF